MAKKSAGISADAVQKATGKSWDEWLVVLDKAGCNTMSHKEIVAVVSEQHGVGPWWQQMVTVGYEQARGLRAEHETATGYSASRAKTIARPIADVYLAWSEKRNRLKWFPSDIAFALRKATKNRSLRITWHDETLVEVMFYEKGKNKCQVTVQHSKLRDEKSVARMKVFWGDVLDKLKSILETPG